MNKILFLHQKLLEAGIPIIGVSDTPRENEPGTRRVDYASTATEQQRQTGNAIADGFDTLTISATKTSIIANGTDETQITSVGLATFNYAVYEGDEATVSGTVPDGLLELSVASEGTYVVEITSGTATGYVEIEATL